MLLQFLTCAFVLSLSSCSSISNYASNDDEKITMIKNTIYIDDFDKTKHKIFFNIRNSTNQQIINKKFILSKISNDGYFSFKCNTSITNKLFCTAFFSSTVFYFSIY
jgi:hypothetical protein